MNFNPFISHCDTQNPINFIQYFLLFLSLSHTYHHYYHHLYINITILAGLKIHTKIKLLILNKLSSFCILSFFSKHTYCWSDIYSTSTPSWLDSVTNITREEEGARNNKKKFYTVIVFGRSLKYIHILNYHFLPIHIIFEC